MTKFFHHELPELPENYSYEVKTETCLILHREEFIVGCLGISGFYFMGNPRSYKSIGGISAAISHMLQQHKELLAIPKPDSNKVIK